MVIEMLRRAIESQNLDSSLMSVVREALDLIDHGKTRNLHSLTESGQDSSQAADLYLFRLERQHIKDPDRVVGLFESIASLKRENVNVRCGIIEMSVDVIATWWTDDLSLRGIMIFKGQSS